MSSFITLEEPAHPPARPNRPDFALWALGFRPFYLLASGFAALSIALWALQFAGWLPRPYLAGPLWHAHEMLFGFALAVVVGFLFTAGRNWTGQPTPSGAPLMALAALWLAGRLLLLTPWGWAAALANVAFPLAAAAALAKPFIAARNRRNYFFIALLLALALAQAGLHAGWLGLIRLPHWLQMQPALDLLLFIVAVMGGRVIPMFTNNGVPGADATRRPRLEQLALGALLALLAADLAGLSGLPLALLCGLASALHLARWLLWQPWKTLRTPLVWVLHIAYAWIPLHLLLRGLAALSWLAPSLATHALTLGAIGGMIIGMMTRTARGHTGRPLRADGADCACYALVLAATLVRVGLPLLQPALALPAVLGSALLWSAGFGLYTLRYWSVLTRARVDGRAG